MEFQQMFGDITPKKGQNNAIIDEESCTSSISNENIDQIANLKKEEKKYLNEMSESSFKNTSSKEPTKDARKDEDMDLFEQSIK